MTYSIVEFTATGMERAENIIPLFLFVEACLFAELLYICLFRGRCLATGLHATVKVVEVNGCGVV
jgi:hypothetical protein